MPPKQQQQNALQRDAEGLALLEKRLLDLEAGLARREAEVEAAEREIGAAQKRAREQDEAEKEAKRPRGGEELPGEGGVPLMPAELMPGLPRARAEEIFLAFDEQDPGFWAGLGPTLQRELGSLEDEREVLALLDGAAVAGQDVGDDDDDDDFAFLDPERWRTMQPTAANMRGFEDAVRRLYRFKGNQQLQDRRDDVTERVRDLVRLRRGESGPPKRMWILRLGGLFHSYEEQNAEYETRDPSAALVMRDVLRVELLPERVRQARRRFTAQFKAAPKGGFAAWERRVAVFEGGATSKKTTAQRASIVASLTRFTAVAGLQAAPPALRIKAFATAMLGKGMTQEQLEAYVARVPGQRGRPRTGEMRTASVGKYVEVLGAKLGVPSGDLAAMKKAILKARLERREVPAHAPPITLEQQRTLVEGLVRGGDEQVTVAACLAWAGALRMADLRALAPTDVVIVGPGLLRVSWWTTKEASLRMRESEVTYRVPLGVALRVSRWVQRGARFTEATTVKGEAIGTGIEDVHEGTEPGPHPAEGCATFFCRRAPDRAPVSPPAPEPGKSRVTPAGATVPARVKARTRRRGVKGSAGRRVGGRRRRLARGCSCLGSSGRSHNSNSSTNDSSSSLTGSSSDSPSSNGNNGPDNGGNTSTSSSICRSDSSPRSSSHNSSNGKGPYSGSPSPSSRSHNSRSSNCLNGSSPSTRSSGTSSRSNNGSCFSFSPPPAPGQQSSGIIPRGPVFSFCLGWVPDQLLVNRYGRGVGIAPHTDQRALGPTVATVSLLSDTVMEWEKGGRKVRTPLPVGTLCHMEGEARCLWTHGIRPADVTQPRVSLTYRSVRGGARSLSHDPPQPSADAPSHPTVGAPRTKRPTDRAQGLLPGKPGRNEEEEHDQGGKDMEPQEFEVAVKMWLGSAVFEAGQTCEVCKKDGLDRLGHHALSCRHGGDWTAKHHAVRDELYMACLDAALEPKKEEKGTVGTKPGIIPGDVSLPRGVNERRPRSIDVTIVNPQSASICQEAAISQGYAARKGEATKYTKYAEELQKNNRRFTAFALESMGGFGAEARSFLWRVAAEAADRARRNKAEVFRDYAERISIQVVKGAARAAIRRGTITDRNSIGVEPGNIREKPVEYVSLDVEIWQEECEALGKAVQQKAREDAERKTS
ncbi:hypothetical protein DIPPA_31097, partial [Diplonema papillatum]